MRGSKDFRAFMQAYAYGNRRAVGKVTEFDSDTGRGAISYRGRAIRFNARDVSHYPHQKIKIGQKVLFEIEHTHRGMRARDVIVYKPHGFRYPPRDPDEIEYEDTPLLARVVVGDSVGEMLETSAPKQDSQNELIALTSIWGKLKLVSLAEDGKYKFLDEGENLHNLYVVSSETVQAERITAELEHLINDLKAKESDFQNFFERNPDFILNDEYKEAHPHVVLSRDNSGPLIPDFVLKPIDQGSLCDLLELKLPTAQVFVLTKNRERFSAAMCDAAAQLREYSRFFDEERNRLNFQQAYPYLNMYKPRMFVIIGRRSAVDPHLQRAIQLEQPNLFLRTYDEVLERMKWKVEKMKKKTVRGMHVTG